MASNIIKTAEEAVAIVQDSHLNHVKIGYHDIDGIMRDKYISREKFQSAMEGGFGACNAVLGWDCADELYDNSSYTGWHTGYPDAQLKIIPESCRTLPFENNRLFFLAEFSGEAKKLCPREVLKRVIERASKHGYFAKSAMEFEFFMFNETPKTLIEKNYSNLETLTPGNFSYSAIRSSVNSNLFEEILEVFEQLRVPLECLHTETGPGVLEAAITVQDALQAGDNAALFKTFMKVIAQKKELMATFMAKWNKNLSGQSGHTHISLWSLDDNRSIFYDSDKINNTSNKMLNFIGGQLKLLPELLCLVAPTINSFARLTPGYWAPTAANWGIDNRTCSVRLIPGSPNSHRLEFRVPGSDVNPYLALAVAIGAGLWGIENGINPGEPSRGNAYMNSTPSEQCLPETLDRAAEQLNKSEAARDLFGDDFINHYVASREWETREFSKTVTDWELKRYFEVI